MFRRRRVVVLEESRSRLESTSLTREAPRRFRGAKTDVMLPNQRIFLRQGNNPLSPDYPTLVFQQTSEYMYLSQTDRNPSIHTPTK